MNRRFSWWDSVQGTGDSVSKVVLWCFVWVLPGCAPFGPCKAKMHPVHTGACEKHNSLCEKRLSEIPLLYGRVACTRAFRGITLSPTQVRDAPNFEVESSKLTAQSCKESADSFLYSQTLSPCYFFSLNPAFILPMTGNPLREKHHPKEVP